MPIDGKDPIGTQNDAAVKTAAVGTLIAHLRGLKELIIDKISVQIGGVSPQLDDTDKLAVSLYGEGTVVGDTPLKAGTLGSLRVALGGTGYILIDGKSNNTTVPADVNGNQLVLVTYPALFNNDTWDRQRNNFVPTVLASAARTATTSSPDQTNYNARGVMVFFSITAVPGVETLTLTIEAKDPVAGTYETLLTGSVEVAAAAKCYVVYPGSGAAANGVDVVNAFPLPRTWRVTVTHSSTGSFTYSVGASYIL